MMNTMNIQLDDGVQFGLGVFETICLKNGVPVLLDWHLERMNRSLEYFHISQKIASEDIMQWMRIHKDEIRQNPSDIQALKIMASEKNRLFLLRENPYTRERIEKGFYLEYSKIIRNETSQLVYHKTMNYGDNILEKRRLKGSGVDDVVFLNTQGQICEGSTTNIFFVKKGQIYTPEQNSGLLPGVLRRYILEKLGAEETVLYPNEINEMEDCFVTNSLMGIMPVKKLGKTVFETGHCTKQCIQKYQMYLDTILSGR